MDRRFSYGKVQVLLRGLLIVYYLSLGEEYQFRQESNWLNFSQYWEDDGWEISINPVLTKVNFIIS